MPIPQPIANQQTGGNIGLFYVCYRLSRMGWNVMPTARNAKGIDILIYSQDASQTYTVQDSHEPNEPPHVHVDRDDLSAKFWLEPVGLARNFGFSPKELRRIQRLTIKHQAAFLEDWHGHLGTGG